MHAYCHLYETTQTDEYRRALIWWLDVNNPKIADKVREKCKVELIRSPRA